MDNIALAKSNDRFMTVTLADPASESGERTGVQKSRAECGLANLDSGDPALMNPAFFAGRELE